MAIGVEDCLRDGNHSRLVTESGLNVTWISKLSSPLLGCDYAFQVSNGFVHGVWLCDSDGTTLNDDDMNLTVRDAECADSSNEKRIRGLESEIEQLESGRNRDKATISDLEKRLGRVNAERVRAWNVVNEIRTRCDGALKSIGDGAYVANVVERHEDGL